jgi:hypothetical protein
VLLINLQRGPATPDSRERRFGLEELISPQLWVTPWTIELLGPSHTHLDFMTRLILKGVAEYQGLIFMRDCLQGQPLHARRNDVDPAVADRLLAYFKGEFLARRAERETVNWLVRQCTRVNAKIAAGVSTEDACVIAVRAIEMLLWGYLTGDTRRPDSAFINPFVIVLTDVEPSDSSGWLSDQLPGWVSFAGRLSKDKPAVLVPEIRPMRAFRPVWQLARRLRRAVNGLGSRPDQSAQRKEIGRIRAELSVALGALVSAGSLALLERLGADRVVAFCDVPIDFLPLGSTVLGLERPSCRYPTRRRNAMRHYHRSIGGGVLTAAYDARSEVAILSPQAPDDVPGMWAKTIAGRVEQALAQLNLKPARIALNNASKSDVLRSLHGVAALFFFGHGQASPDTAWITLDDVEIFTDDVAAQDWSGTLVFLVGCDTSVADEPESDMAAAFLDHGALGVIGTSAKVSFGVALVFFFRLYAALASGDRLDYAFFGARRYAFLMEIAGLRDDGANITELDEQLLAQGSHSLDDWLARLGLDWEEARERAIYSLSFSLLGGVGETIR